jgi:hypothetical protein
MAPRYKGIAASSAPKRGSKARFSPIDTTDVDVLLLKKSRAKIPPTAGRSLIEPLAFRIPKDGDLDSYFGGRRTFWNNLILPSRYRDSKPPVASVVMHVKGVKRGMRFILFASAKAYFARIAAEQGQLIESG